MMGRGSGHEQRQATLLPSANGTYPLTNATSVRVPQTARDLVLRRIRQALAVANVPAPIALEAWAVVCSAFDDCFDAFEHYRQQASDLGYHGTSHSVLQVAYDAALLLDQARAHPAVVGPITLEDTLAVLVAAIFHDRGYLDPTGGPAVTRGVIHVDESARIADAWLAARPWPGFLRVDPACLRQKVRRAILATRFPKTDAEQAEIDQLPMPDRFIARLVEIADLGGQTATVDYLDQLEALHAEMAAAQGATTADAVLGPAGPERWGKGERFVTFVEHLLPTRAPWFDAIYGGPAANPFRHRWQAVRDEARRRVAWAAPEALVA